MTRKKLIPKPRRTIKAKRTKIFSYLQKVNCKKNVYKSAHETFQFYVRCLFYKIFYIWGRDRLSCIVHSYLWKEVQLVSLTRSHKSFSQIIPQANRRKLREKREFKKLRLQGKRHIKIELCAKLSLLRLFHVNHVVQNRRSAFSLAWHEWFSCKGKKWKIYYSELALSLQPQIWKFHVVVWQTTSKHCTKKRAARAARLSFFIQPIKSLICGVVVDVAVVKS